MILVLSRGRYRCRARVVVALTGHPNIAILVAMSLSEHLSLADMKNRLSEVVDRLEREHGRVVVTKHGRPAAVMLSIEDLESLEETLEILSSPALVATIGEGRADAKAGRVARLSREQLLARIAQQ
jgi:antitoxin YefM